MIAVDQVTFWVEQLTTRQFVLLIFALWIFTKIIFDR